MPNHNHIELSGHIVRKPQLSFTNSGSGYTKFTIAVGRNYGEETDFIKCIAWNRGNFKLAEYIANDIDKGKLVTVIGELNIGEYEKDGQKHFPATVKVEKCIYERPKQNKGQSKKQKPQNKKPAEEPDDFDPDDVDFDEEIPF